MRHAPWTTLATLGFVLGCGTKAPPPLDTSGGSFEPAAGDAGARGGGYSLPPTGGVGAGSGGGSLAVDATAGDAALTTTADPQTCEEAATAHTYVGCDYWPTVVANNVWSIFDFAAVVANAGTTTATVTVTGPNATRETATVPPGQLAKIYLPWVPALKGPDADACGDSMPLTASVLARASAFHLVSTVPVTVYQFNALEYQGVQGEGPPGKSWASCPGLNACNDPNSANFGATSGCFSFSNDASLLLPSTAMTGNYRVAGHEGVVLASGSGQTVPIGGYAAITATQDGTTVQVQVSSSGQVAAGTDVPAAGPGGTFTLTLDQGDVAELVAPGGADLSGSLVHATAPVQVVTGHPCLQIPPTEPACDHIEETVFPAEALGKDYVVTRPAGPSGDAVGHQVRLYGNFDGTTLTYDPAPPPGCPTTINAGQVVECGLPACATTVLPTDPRATCAVTSTDFEVQGSQPFAVGTFSLGASVVDPNGQEGDPAESFATPVQQYRTKYVFLAPDDYKVSYADVVTKPGTTITLDGQTVTAAAQAVGTSGYGVERLKLGPGQSGAHVLTASQPVGVQIVGYGLYTSYMVPGGLDLAHIAPAPVIR